MTGVRFFTMANCVPTQTASPEDFLFTEGFVAEKRCSCGALMFERHYNHGARREYRMDIHFACRKCDLGPEWVGLRQLRPPRPKAGTR